MHSVNDFMSLYHETALFSHHQLIEHVTETTGPALAGTGAPRVMVHCCSKFELGLCGSKAEIMSRPFSPSKRTKVS